MKFALRILLLVVLVTGTLTQDGFDLSDALGDPDPTPAKPAKPQEPKSPEKPKAGGGLDLLDAFGPDAPTQKPKKPSAGDTGGFDLNDAVGPDTNPKPDKPVIKPPKSGGGGGDFGDSDLLDVSGGDYKPDRTGGGKGRAVDPGYDPQGGADHPQEGGSGPMAGIISAIGVALVGAASSYMAYQKKKLCFKMQGGADPESGKGQRGAQSDPQVFSDLLRNN